ncbi:MAG: FKBP-type peptidyl-prolyl cis-trans isomerase [Vicinamibacterales bacterium]|nr:FKBP-type peptidyl-prolyl cis-trans isomerase [Vicinamibacterales bacterium]
MSTRVVRALITLACLGPALAVSACGSGPTSPSSVATSVGTYSQTDLVVGSGAVAATGNRVTVAYTGWLYDTSRPDGKGTSFDASTSFGFTIGAGQVIAGWDQGVPGMRVGGLRRLILPPNLAYGSRSPGAGIPPNATLVFDITLNSIQ